LGYGVGVDECFVGVVGEYYDIGFIVLEVFDGFVLVWL